MYHVIETEKKTNHNGVVYYQLHIICPMCRNRHYVFMNEQQYARYNEWLNNEDLIQNLLGDLSDDQRESLITGFCQHCQINYFDEEIGTDEYVVTDANMDRYICSICGKALDRFSINNAAPFKGNCCNECNDSIVMNTRIALLGLTVPYGIFFDVDNKVENVFPKNNCKFTAEEIAELLKTSKFDMFKIDGFVVIKQRIANVDNRLFNECFEGQCLPQKGNILVVKEEYLV